MEADRPDLQQAVERRRQHVLAGVLLHVLEAARPIDPPAHRTARNLPFDHVHDAAVVFVDDVDDAGAAERAGIERLAAGRGIEGRAVEHDGVTCGDAGHRLGRHDRGVELGGVRVGVVDALGHGVICALQSADRQYPPLRIPWLAGGSCRSGRRARPKPPDRSSCG